ncbi:MAG: proline/glycine betaine ABC transporter ATP-binding protein, partial [Methylobacterium sp.]
RFVEHIDVSSVLTLGRLVGAAQPRLHEAALAAEAWPLVEHRPDPAFVVTCARDTPIGRIGRDRLAAAGTAGRRLDTLMEAGIAKASATDVLKSVLPLLADEPAGVAVVDEAGRFVGLLTRERALRALAGSRDGNAADASSDLPLASTRSSPWTGPSPTAGASPNSLWTNSPTAA